MGLITLSHRLAARSVHCSARPAPSGFPPPRDLRPHRSDLRRRPPSSTHSPSAEMSRCDRSTANPPSPAVGESMDSAIIRSLSCSCPSSRDAVLWLPCLAESFPARSPAWSKHEGARGEVCLATAGWNIAVPIVWRGRQQSPPGFRPCGLEVQNSGFCRRFRGAATVVARGLGPVRRWWRAGILRG